MGITEIRILSRRVGYYRCLVVVELSERMCVREYCPVYFNCRRSFCTIPSQSVSQPVSETSHSQFVCYCFCVFYFFLSSTNVRVEFTHLFIDVLLFVSAWVIGRPLILEMYTYLRVYVSQ